MSGIGHGCSAAGHGTHSSPCTPPSRKVTPLADPIKPKVSELVQKYIGAQNEKAGLAAELVGSFSFPLTTVGLLGAGTTASISFLALAGAMAIAAPVALVAAVVVYSAGSAADRDVKRSTFLIDEYIEANPLAQDNEVFAYVNNEWGKFSWSSCDVCSPDPAT